MSTSHGSRQPNIFTIEAGLPFAKTLAQYLLQKTQNNPQELTQYRLLLPTRRACRIMRETFLNENDGKPMMLPIMTPLGDVDEEDLSLLIFGQQDGFLDVAAAINPMRRHLLLSKLIMAAPDFAHGAEHALLLAKALARFIDQIEVEGLSFAELHKIVPEEFSAHWGITLKFLEIIGQVWPSVLAAEDVVEPTKRRNLLLHALCDFWRETQPEDKIIAAGATGSIPAARLLLSVVSTLPNGQVVLPGVDLSLSEEAWKNVAETHPQHSFKKLFTELEINAQHVKKLTLAPDSDNVIARRKIASAMMWPAEETRNWKTFASQCHHEFDVMLEGVSYYSCATQQDEAQIIALMMREHLEQPEKVCALVTPDRNLAKRVQSIMCRWGVELDDSAGTPLLETRLGKFLLLTVTSLQGALNAGVLLSWMKTSLFRMGYEQSQLQMLISKLEHEVLRSGDVLRSLDDLKNHTDDEELVTFLRLFEEMISPLSLAVQSGSEKKFTTFLKAHLQVLENLAGTPELSGDQVLWRGDVGEAASLFLSELYQHAPLLETLGFEDYVEVFKVLSSDVTVRSAYGVHPRLLILGQLEARLTHADFVIMSGLNEGTWPADVGHDPWMSRPMRGAFGLPAIEQSVGISAHDFVQGFCAKRVALTRAEKVDGSPTVPARWLDRLTTVLRAAGRELSDLTDHKYVAWSQELDACDHVNPAAPPEPRPPVSTRPNAASVTKFEQWLQNPYAIYAHYVLKIRKLNPLTAQNDAALRGTILHEVLDRFTQLYPLEMPSDAEGEIIQIARQVMAETVSDSDMLQYWWPKLMNIAAWFVAHEKVWRQDAKFCASEVEGHFDLEVDGLPFKIYGKADRVDKMHGGYALIDYKSGGSYPKSKLKKGQLPQLPLEALMAQTGGFDGRGFFGNNEELGVALEKAEAVYLGHWILKGSRNAAGQCEALEQQKDVEEAIEVVLEGLRSLIQTFRRVETPFYAVPDRSKAPRFNDYEQLSRQKEWAAFDAQEEEG